MTNCDRDYKVEFFEIPSSMDLEDFLEISQTFIKEKRKEFKDCKFEICTEAFGMGDPKLSLVCVRLETDEEREERLKREQIQRNKSQKEANRSWAKQKRKFAKARRGG